jgi:hypothetical protein
MGHGIADGHNLQAPGHQYFNNPTRGLAFAAAGAHSPHGDDRFAALDLGVLGSQQHKISPGRIYEGPNGYNVLIGHIAV